MATPFLDPEEYDEQAHHLYQMGEYDRALELLKEGLSLYPNSLELLLGLGYTRLAREEFVWAKIAFERALAIEPNDDDARAGLGEVLLRFGQHDRALELFNEVKEGVPPLRAVDAEQLIGIGRALYREQLYREALDFFDTALALSPLSADGYTSRAYTLHRLNATGEAIEDLIIALELNSEHTEARIYLGHLLYDQGKWEDALDHFEAIPLEEQWDALAVCRVLELKTTLRGLDSTDPEITAWNDRLDELASFSDPIDELLSEVERQARFPR